MFGSLSNWTQFPGDGQQTMNIYSAKSAYAIQFKGSYCSFDAQAIWKVEAEGKHNFFAWLMVESRIDPYLNYTSAEPLY